MPFPLGRLLTFLTADVIGWFLRRNFGGVWRWCLGRDVRRHAMSGPRCCSFVPPSPIERQAAKYGAAEFLTEPVDFERLKAQLGLLPSAPD